MEDNTFGRVKTTTDSNKLAGFIAHIFESGGDSYKLLCIGPAAVNQANKAVSSARGILAPKGIEIAMIPSFFKTITDSQAEEKTGIQIEVFKLTM